MSASNGLQGQSGFAGEQTNNVNGMYSAMPAQNIYSTAMGQLNIYGNAQTQQGPLHAQPHFGGQQPVVTFDGNLFTLPMRTPSSGAMNFAPGNTQLAQQVPRSQPGFVNPQMINANTWNPEMALGNNLFAMEANTQFQTSIGQQPGQFQNIQNDQHAQIYQNTDQYQYGHNYQFGQDYQLAQNYQNFSINQSYATNPTGDRHQPGAGFPPQAGTPPQAANPPQSGTPPHAGIPSQAGSPPQVGSDPNAGSPNAGSPKVRAAEPLQPSSVTEVTKEFQNHVNELVREKATTFKAHIKNRTQFARYEQAVWKAKLSGGKQESKSGDYPQDEAGELRVIERIFNAIVNVDGEQDPATDTGDFANCLAVKIIQGLSSIDVELLAHKLMRDMHKIQSGERVLEPEAKIIQEDSFMAKVDKVVAALSASRVNKLLCRSATTTDNWVSRIAADPSGERRQKILNINNNTRKNKVLAAESQKKGTARKGKGKRAAAAEPDAEPNHEATPKVSDAGRPTKRPRTTKKSSQAARAQNPSEAREAREAGPREQPQRIESYAAGPSNGHAHADAPIASQAPVNQVGHANNIPINDLNHGGSFQAHQPNELVNHGVTPSHPSEPKKPTPEEVTEMQYNLFFGPILKQPDTPSQPQASSSSRAGGNPTPIPVLDTSLWGFSPMDHTDQTQGQPTQPQPVAHQSAEVESAQQAVDGDDMFGDLDFEKQLELELADSLAPVAEFNSQN
ncbi:hypothetical protein FJTKL_09359 [Diaporthe vaccinii]|uniref:Uncharacterized protein n=1 Tax=Diaporthe vaccinii TaxID=105482 RepID=A0ABR4FCF9_9PEZI